MIEINKSIIPHKPAALIHFGIARKVGYFMFGFIAAMLLIGAALAESVPEYISITKCTNEQIARYSDSAKQYPEFYNADFFLINENCTKGDVK